MKKALFVCLGGLVVVFSVAGRPVQTDPPQFAAGTWQSVGPVGGNVIAVAAHPQNANELYAAAGISTTQIYKSTDGGQTWSRISTINSNSSDFAINPLNPNIMYVLVGWGIYKSTDKGATWTFYSFGANNYSSSGRLGVNRGDGNTVYASGYRYESAGTYYMTVYKSTDGGNTWTFSKLSPGASYAYTNGLAVSPTNANIIYACGYYYSGTAYFYKVYKTTNGGNTWQDVSGSIYGTPYAVVLDPNNSNKAYVLISGKVFRTSDGGGTWAASAGYVYGNDLAIDPVNTNILFAGYNKTVYKSMDSGQNWTSYSTGLLGYCNHLLISPSGSSSQFTWGAGGGIFYGSTAGVFRSADGGTTWQDISTGISANNVKALGIAGSSPNKLFAECANNGFYKSDNFGASWQRCADFYRCDAIERILVNPNDANEIYILAGG